GLVLYGTYASIKAAPWSVDREDYERFLAGLEARWGEGVLVRLNAPGRVEDKAFVQWFGRLERAVASPSAILALMRANYEIDVGHLLTSIQVPPLILHREGDALIPVEAGRHLARSIPRARYLELPGEDHMLQALDQEGVDLLLDEVEEFVTGHRPNPARGGAVSTGIAVVPGVDDAIAELERCREILASGEDGCGLAGVTARSQAVVAAARGSWTESEAQFIKASETFRRLGMVWQEAHTFQSCGRALQAAADRRAAIEKLDTAIDVYRRHAASQRCIDGVEGALPRTNGAPGSPLAVFRREGDYWTVSWLGDVVRLKDAKGFHYIAYLLSNPGRQVLACELAAAGTGPTPRRVARDPGDTAGELGAR